MNRGMLARGAVTVLALLAGALAVPGQASAPGLAPGTDEPSHRAGYQVGGSAGQRYGWGTFLFDYAWEYGESLTDAPNKGTKKKGEWIDRSTGTGRVAHYNGGVSFESSYSSSSAFRARSGDLGTTTLTLEGSPQAYGRWEFKRRVRAAESRGRDYRVLIELVPAKKSDTCDGAAITVASVVPSKDVLLVGARSANGKAAYGRSIKIRGLNGDNSHSYAVEVSKRYVTWFVDGRVVATLKDRKALPRGPLTPRLSMVGQTTGTGSATRPVEMNTTEVIYDWMRAWPLARGQHLSNGPALKKVEASTSC